MADDIIVPGAPIPWFPFPVPGRGECPPYCGGGPGDLPSSPPSEPPYVPPPPPAPVPPEEEPEEPEPPPVVVVNKPKETRPGDIALLMPLAYVNQLPQLSVQVVAKRVAPRVGRSLLARVGRFVLANPIVAGLVALLLPSSLNKGEKEFLDAYYRAQRLPNVGGLPNVGVIGQIEVRAPRLRGPTTLPEGRPPFVLPVGTPPFMPADPWSTTPEPAPESDRETRPPRRPPGSPIGAPAAPLDPDTDDPVWPRSPPRRAPRTRFPNPSTEIGPEGPVTYPEPFELPLPSPVRRPAPRPTAPPVALPYPFDVPVEAPAPVTKPQPVKQPKPTPVTTLVGSPFGLPFLSPSPRPGGSRKPLPDPLLRLPPATNDPCNCAKQEKKKKKKKEPRTVCYAGTYREKSRSLSKKPRRKVPCQ